MATREEKIAFLKSQSAASSSGAAKPKTREEKIAFLQSKQQDSGSGGILGAIAEVGKAIDSYGGAPTRAAISAGIKGENPLSAAYNQFGEDPSKAPSGEDIAKQIGVSTERRPGLTAQQKREFDLQNAPGLVADRDRSGYYKDDGPRMSNAQLAGFAIDVAADPLNLVPGAALAKGGKVAGQGARLAGRGVIKASDAAASGVKMLPGGNAVIKGGQIAAKTGEIVTDSAKNTAVALKKMFTPRQAEDFKDLTTIAKKNGIDPKLLPESIEFGQDSFISRASRNRAEGVLGETHLKKFNEGLDAVRDAFERKVSQIGGGSVPSSIEAGQIIRKGFDDGVDRIFDNVGMTHDKVTQAIPNLKLSPDAIQKIESKLNGIERWAKGRSERGFTQAQRTQAEQVLRAIEAVRSSKVPEKTLKSVTKNGQKFSEWVNEDLYSYKRMVETLRDVGDVAFKSKNVMADIPPDIAKFKELYHTISDGLIDTVRQSAGAPVADELLESNKIITELMGDRSTVASVIGNKNMSPERVFKALIEQGDTTKLKALKRILSPEEFKKLKGSFLESQIKRNADDGFTFKSLQNNLRNKKSIISELFDANEIEEIGELIRLGDRFGEPVLSTSGTGASSLFRNIGEGIRSGIESDTVIKTLKESARKRSSKALPPAKSIEKAAGQSLIESGKTDNLKRIAAISPIAFRSLTQSTGGKPGEIKGEKKWAIDGATKLIEHGLKDKKIIESLSSSKEGRRLLIQASDLNPGTPAMENILKEAQSQFGKGGN